MIVIYHANCIDGFTSAWCAWLEYGDAARYIPAQYGDFPPAVLGEDVLIVDFSYTRETLETMAREARSIRVLDHHKTAEAQLFGLEFCTFDMNRSGAGLAWDHLFPGMPRCQLVNYVEDRDLWRWKLPDSREVSAYIGSWRPTFQKWSDLREVLDDARDQAFIEGCAILRALDGYVDANSKRFRFGQIGGHDVPIINTTYAVSELIGKLAEAPDVPFAAGWFQKEDGQFVYSLRSRGDFDVSAIAKQYGGGGHKNAAGFTVERLVHDHPRPTPADRRD